ncbi:MAG TPA: hypothetical protein VEY89_03480 [Candidatus Dormibacteraeota bacterium]|nr:hypothetical protein [Candidatus Dormibacteraeota bacterium]
MRVATLLCLTLLLCSCATRSACHGELRPINPAAGGVAPPGSARAASDAP